MAQSDLDHDILNNTTYLDDFDFTSDFDLYPAAGNVILNDLPDLNFFPEYDFNPQSPAQPTPCPATHKFRCKNCPESFRRRCELNRHVLKQHNAIQMFPWLWRSLCREETLSPARESGAWVGHGCGQKEVPPLRLCLSETRRCQETLQAEARRGLQFQVRRFASHHCVVVKWVRLGKQVGKGLEIWGRRHNLAYFLIANQGILLG
ncbi:hypothetical protein LTR10_012724 [Elasticomyces elasticus]|uniref:C2H2-type domain-containing protein n=1 Tax=Exophiala sideris TaxID=1016849 RepID=A0ABR0JR83_9EURO|nr:hypothetical protein LTR10_012724 [Elasticomyces elasticus]KAK5034602.1 hypothetical protein LTR13_006257 [Exophiala sideris]KAK5040076.1 hypothetical protein LTS07_000573 [Exophiala sideris]KAK5068454.1 hypothetical protein LTR69_000574 [Exophiala sideris]KAK5187756.1 hypothetical protein LTR44_000574 [Eurotiomycetes sp. CCFEE 6388]